MIIKILSFCNLFGYFSCKLINMKVELNSENIQKIFDISIVLSISDTKKIVVYKKDGAIQISSIDKDIKEGTLIEL